MRSKLINVLLFLLLIPAVGNAAKPIMNMIDVPIPIKIDGSQYSADEVQAAIIEGCLARRWSASLDGTGMIRATLNVKNKHFAEVEIPFTASAYSIIYVSSDNLDYNEARQRIHRNYNKWVLILSRAIDQAVRKRSSANSDLNGGEEGPDIYSEILKLDDLRKRGLLSDDEFETEKRKLLATD